MKVFWLVGAQHMLVDLLLQVEVDADQGQQQQPGPRGGGCGRAEVTQRSPVRCSGFEGSTEISGLESELQLY